MAILIISTVFCTTVDAHENIVENFPLYAGERLYVEPDYDEYEERDWLAPVGGGVIGIPAGSWTQIPR